MQIRPRYITLALVAIVVLALVIKPELISALFVFVFLGVIPGTQMTVPAWLSLVAFAAVFVLAIRWLLDTPVYRPAMNSQDKTRRHAARRRVLKQSAANSRKTSHSRYKKRPAQV
nr:ABC transporter transmembrane region protein [uncultured bacterium]